MSIPGITPILPLPPLGKVGASEPVDLSQKADIANGAQKAGTDFAKFLNDALQQVEASQQNADAATAGLVTGQVQDLHTVMVALEKASLNMALTVEVRNKVLDAYNQIMRMQI